MLRILHDWDRRWFLVTSPHADGAPGEPLRDAHVLRRALAALGRHAANLAVFRSLLAREPGFHSPLSDARALAEVETRLLQRRWTLLQGDDRVLKAGAAPDKEAESPWVAEDDGTSSNDQGLDIALGVEIEEPLTLDFEEEVEPPFSLEVEDDLPHEEEPPQTETAEEEPAEME